MSTIRNIQTHRWWRRVRNRSSYYEAELVHNLQCSILEPEFVEHDFWFLNHQARWYLDRCHARIYPAYEVHRALIRELFELVPEDQHDALEWAGPEADTEPRSARHP